MAQQIVVRPLGIITQPNKLGVYPAGALKTALNAYLRSPGVVEAARLPVTSFNLNGVPDTAFVAGFDNLVMYLCTGGAGTNFALWHDLTASTFSSQTFAVGSLPFLLAFPTAGRFGAIRVRDRVLLSTSQGTFSFDVSAGAPPNATRVNAAGLKSVRLDSSFVSSQTAAADGTIGANTACHCVAVLRRKFADGYELVSPPSAATHVVNLNANGVDTITHSLALLGGQALEGDVIEIYRTRSQPITTTNPFSGTNTGGTYLLSTTLTLGSSVVGTFFVPDRVPDAQLGEALYTNPGMRGGQSIATPPPGCLVSAAYRGHAFYMHRVDPPAVTLRVPVWWGPMNFGATSGAYIRTRGIGSRSCGGNLTSGSPTVTAIPAADIAGVVVGQITDDSRFPQPAIVTAVGASTVTMNGNATVTAAGTQVTFKDVIELNGTRFDASSLSQLLFTTAAYSSFVVRCLDRIYPSILTNTLGFTPPTVPAEGFTVVVDNVWEASTPLTIRATNGANYSPALPAIEAGAAARSFAGKTVANGIAWSEQNQPENVPPANVVTCGTGEIYAAVTTRDAIWIFASDGLWRLSGTGGDSGSGYDWRIDPVDATLSLSGPQCVVTHKDVIYAYTSRGLVSIDSAGNITEITQGVLADQLPGPTWQQQPASYTTATAMFMVADETNDEIVLRVPGTSGLVWVYNVNTKAFTQLQAASSFGEISHGAYSPKLQAIAIASKKPSSQLSSFSFSSATRASMTLEFQPAYADNPFALRLWQRVDWSFAPLASQVSMTFVPNAQSGLLATRNVPAAGTDGDGSRVSFGVPRNAPAVGNQLVVGCVTNQTAQQLQLQGLAITYSETTDERRTR